jgi:hypothetical protein
MPAPVSRDALLAIGRLLEESDSLPLLPSRTWRTVKDLGINRKRSVKRGCRCGQHLQRGIPVISAGNVDTRTNHHISQAGVNHANLARIPAAQPKETNRQLKVGSLNCRSVKNKTISLCDHIAAGDYDIFALTETWLGSAVDKICEKELVPSGYSLKHVPHQSGRTGGGDSV